jgi:hypothetical protein
LQQSEHSPLLRPGTNCTTLPVSFDMGPAPAKNCKLGRVSLSQTTFTSGTRCHGLAPLAALAANLIEASPVKGQIS